MKRASRSSGFTLLEVLLALAILVGSLATIGVLAEQGLSSAHRAAAISKAQLHCESKLAEITAGIVAPTNVTVVPLETDPEWSYSVTATPNATDPTLLSVRVTLIENIPATRRPVEFSLVRWIIDPLTTTAGVGGTTSTSTPTGGGSQ
ncbi:MAG: prepilin-type N-terminal cleavage/methylation domain-containing protein [Planctomycetia bacterium]|nr:prepilin-type N-terminal cleavage/methylation domain-containing protein [Planctomycetia bacterium]